MIGFLIGTMSLLGLVALAVSGRHHHRWHHAHAFGGHGPHGGFGGWGHHGSHGHHGPFREGSWDGDGWGAGFAGFAGRGLRRHLRLREDQEEIVTSAVRDLGDALEDLARSFHDSREPLGDAFRGETLDEVRLATVFEGHDADLARARKDVVAALKKAHAALDPEQRAKVAHLLAKGPRRGWRV